MGEPAERLTRQGFDARLQWRRAAWETALSMTERYFIDSGASLVPREIIMAETRIPVSSVEQHFDLIIKVADWLMES